MAKWQPVTATWLADVKAALRIWRRTPVLPVIAAVLAAVAFLPQLTAPQPAGCGIGTNPPCRSGSQGAFLLLSLLTFPASLYFIGFVGAERWWYAHVSRGEVPAAGTLWRIAWMYFGRFFRLGLLTILISSPLVLPFALGVVHDKTRLSLVFLVWSVALDIALTFVTPALAFSTDSAWQALKIGVTTLDRLWPRDMLYVLVPPLAITIVARATPGVFGSRAVTAFAGAAAQLLTVLFAGATTLLYIREVDPHGPDRVRYGPMRYDPLNQPRPWESVSR